MNEHNNDQTAFMNDPTAFDGTPTSDQPESSPRRLSKPVIIAVAGGAFLLCSLLILTMLRPMNGGVTKTLETPSPTIPPAALSTIREKIQPDLEEARRADPDQLNLSFPPVDFKSRLSEPGIR